MDMDAVPSTWKEVANSLATGTTVVPKSVAKLIETISDQLGVYLNAGNILRKAKKEADAAVVQAKSEAEVAAIKAESAGDVAVIKARKKIMIQEFEGRANERVANRELQRQANLESVATQSIQLMQEEVSEQPVEQDWVAEFVNQSQDVSDAEMQSLWARILAGEVARPGSFSRRTLAVVRTMSKLDADLFIKFCVLVWEYDSHVGRRSILPLFPFQGLPTFPGIVLDLEALTRLEAMGLIRYETRATTGIPHVAGALGPRTVPLVWSMDWYYQGRHFVFSKDLPPPVMGRPGWNIPTTGGEFHVGPFLLTDVGTELHRIADPPHNQLYMNSLLETLRWGGWRVTETNPTPPNPPACVS